MAWQALGLVKEGDDHFEAEDLEREILDKVMAAAGLRDRQYGYDEDIETARLVATALKFGLPLEALLQMLRVTSEGQVLKQIGDEFMLVFPEQRTPCRSVIQRAAATEPRFPALRIGAHSGSILYREGDYVGANVNLSSRCAPRSTRRYGLTTPYAACSSTRTDTSGGPYD